MEVGRRTGDISPSIKQKKNRTMPEVLITTPESVHILFAQKIILAILTHLIL